MYSLLFLLLFLGCYCLYITSAKARLGKIPPRVQRYLQSPQQARVLAGVLFTVCWLLLILHFGVGSGTFAFGAFIMTGLSLLVLLNPFHYLRWTQLLALFAVAIVLETLIF